MFQFFLLKLFENDLLPPSANGTIKSKRAKLVSLVKHKEMIPPGTFTSLSWFYSAKTQIVAVVSFVWNKVGAQKLDQLCVRLNNLHYALSQLQSLKDRL